MPATDYAPTHAAAALTRYQKWQLSKMARAAWILRGRPGDEAEWRREQSIAACGHRISTAGQAHWAVLKARFLDHARRSGEAFETLMRDTGNALRIARWKLRKECAARKLPLAYPAAICRKQYRCDLANATAPQLWRLIFTIRNRRPVTRSVQSARSAQS